MRRQPRVSAFLGLLLAVGLTLGACGEQAAPGAKPAKAKKSAHLVSLFTTELAPVSSRHERSGNLRYNRTVRIHNQEEGRIKQLPWYEGDKVKAGQQLALLEDDLIQAELAKARANTHQARVDLQRVSDLMKKRAASQDELARARTAVEVAEAEEQLLDTRLQRTRMLAPFDGVVTERLAEPGDVMPKYGHLLTLADPNSLMSEVKVSELLLPHLKLGDPVQVRIDALGDKTFDGHISRIHPQVNAITRQGIVEILLEPVPAGARAGQFARITLQTAAVPRLLIPFSALRRDNEGEYVFLYRDGKAERVAVQSGIRIADKIELLSGIKAGQQVISRGFLGLNAGMAVKPVDKQAKPAA